MECSISPPDAKVAIFRRPVLRLSIHFSAYSGHQACQISAFQYNFLASRTPRRPPTGTPPTTDPTFRHSRHYVTRTTSRTSGGWLHSIVRRRWWICRRWRSSVLTVTMHLSFS